MKLPKIPAPILRWLANRAIGVALGAVIDAARRELEKRARRRKERP